MEEGKIASQIFHGSCIACPGDHGGQTRGRRGQMTAGNSMQRCLDKKLTIFTVLMYSKSLKLKSIRKQGSVKLEALVDYNWCYKMRFPKLEDYS